MAIIESSQASKAPHSENTPAGLPKYTGIDFETNEVTVPVHPLGIRPSGNAYAAKNNLKPAAGFLGALPDDILIQILEQLDAPALKHVGSLCKALYAFSRLDDLWKVFCFAYPTANRNWQGTWRSTYMSLPECRQSKIDCTGLYSDILHRPFYCAHAPLKPFTVDIPSDNHIPRFCDLSPTEFSSCWTDRPFILTDPVKKWPIYQSWSVPRLLAHHGNTCFRAESVDWSLSKYVQYMRNSAEESPLYLFDRSFVSKMALDVSYPNGSYWAPTCFSTDLFSVLGPQRPDHRWLIMGPARSGSTFHLDPNGTSAWNAVVRGAKYWIMFPSRPRSSAPPGVFVSDDQSEVTSPLSIAEWLLGFHAEARKTPGCMEGICEEGEVLHVPSGWWHLVVNLRECIAVTQNFVPERHLGNVLGFLKNKPEQVSGFAKTVISPYELFVEKMREKHSESLAKGIRDMEESQRGKKRKWEDLVEGLPNRNFENEAAMREFGFRFGEQGEEDVP